MGGGGSDVSKGPQRRPDVSAGGAEDGRSEDVETEKQSTVSNDSGQGTHWALVTNPAITEAV